MTFNRITLALTSLAIAGTAIAGTAIARTPMVNTSISEAEVLAAQKGWGDALVAISDTFSKSGQPAARSKSEP